MNTRFMLSKIVSSSVLFISNTCPKRILLSTFSVYETSKNLALTAKPVLPIFEKCKPMACWVSHSTAFHRQYLHFSKTILLSTLSMRENTWIANQLQSLH